MFLNPTSFVRRLLSFSFFFYFCFYVFCEVRNGAFTRRRGLGHLREDEAWGVYCVLYSGGVDNVFSFPCSCFYYFSGHEKG